MKHLRNFVVMLAMAIGLTGLAPVNAAEEPGQFTLTPQLPSNQNPKTSGYFDLLVKPGQTQTLTVQLTNSSDQPGKFQVWANPGLTSDNGAIDYSQRHRNADAGAPLAFRQIATLPQHVYTVGANSHVAIPLTLKLPNKQFRGRVLGALNVVQVGKGAATTTSGNTVIRNKVGYSLAVVLQQSREPVAPQLTGGKARPKAVNHWPTIQLTFHNPAATIIPGLTLQTRVTRQQKTYLKHTSSDYQVAPNSSFHLNLDLNGQPLRPGKYTVETTASSGKFFKRHFRSQFTVTRPQADAINRNTVVKASGPNYWMIAAIVAVILTLVFAALWWRQRHTHH
ncbi:MAG: DUF916 and DUF3324 domain-containing protein [Lactobacillus sp.]|jgi:hypothetical protein|nr:DUF916 and DUF3324 domain-containing protein [Lactobacillus sp.]MCI2033368.1 DUF916 and DUF3324 domain-containing protein [Lactobacillus sp.]